jgi:histidyl-tRNA synthetase
MKTDNVKGFKDYTNQEAEKRAEIKKIIQKQFELYGFEPAETPIIEYEEFVKADNSNDEAVSEIFKLQDRGKRKLALRYEFTFQLKRLAKNQKLPYKRYELGPVFRDEPISANRFRQFIQCDIDTIGSTIKDEAEILSIVSNILTQLKIKFTININNRKLLNEILEEQKIKDKEAVIREIDKLDKLPESEVKKNLKKYKAQNLLSIFKKPESYFKKYKSYSEIQELKKYCKLYKTNIKFQPSLARGLSYYNSSVFEIKSNIKESIAAGGSYRINNL